MHKFLGGLMLSAALLGAPALAKEPKTYQVTGEVVSADADLIVVNKGKEKWEIARSKTDKADIKAGEKVTIMYRMMADSVEVKSTKAAAKTDAKPDGAMKTETKK